MDKGKLGKKSNLTTYKYSELIKKALTEFILNLSLYGTVLRDS